MLVVSVTKYPVFLKESEVSGEANLETRDGNAAGDKVSHQ